MRCAEAALPAGEPCVLAAHGAVGREVDELSAYAGNEFVPSVASDVHWPLTDEPCVAAWEEYAARANTEGAVAVLRSVMPQLRFPIRAGIGSSEPYRAATLRGQRAADPEGGTRFADAAGVRILLHQTPAGRVPIVLASAREDFEALVRAVTRRNEPAPLPASMGACIVGGYNNWERVARLRTEWEAANPVAAAAGGWSRHFRETVVPQRELYQDRFVLLSSGPYSAVEAGALGLDAEAWNRTSVAIRLEHECAHYFTRRAWGSMRNSLHDELIADYHGIRAATGLFRPEWFLSFMGLEGDAYREGGRLENYRGDPVLSDGAFRVLQRMVRSAAVNLVAIDALRPRGPLAPAETARTLGALATLSLDDLAAPDGPLRFRSIYESAGSTDIDSAARSASALYGHKADIARRGRAARPAATS